MSTAPTTEATGSCLCGAVKYKITGTLRKVVYCHCEQCRKTSGHFVAATACDTDSLDICEDAGLTWYESSDIAKRGFCSRCGGSLFWQPSQGNYVAIMAGTLDAPTGLASREHIWVDYASDYYTIDDGLPQFGKDHADLWEDMGE
jgi:hypothetical protein